MSPSVFAHNIIMMNIAGVVAGAATLPVTDWQFWVVTAIVITALYFVARPIVRSFRINKSGGGGGGSCPNCASGGGSSSSKPKKTKLTIGGKKV